MDTVLYTFTGLACVVYESCADEAEVSTSAVALECIVAEKGRTSDIAYKLATALNNKVHVMNSLSVHQALAAWLLYALNRRRKAERYAQAMERYRRQLVTMGVTQWIKVYSKRSHSTVFLFCRLGSPPYCN